MFNLSILYDVLRGNHNRITTELLQERKKTQAPAKNVDPRVLWLGCSDAKPPISLISGLETGQTVVHCNLANQVREDDLSFQAALEYALRDLSIQHIVVCGHYGCKGILNVLESDDGTKPNMNDWFSGLYRLAAQYGNELRTLPSQQARANRLTELNVLHQAKRLENHPLVVKNRVTVLAWMDDKESGKIKDLKRSKMYSKLLLP